MKKILPIIIVSVSLIFAQAPLQKKSAALEQTLNNKSADAPILVWVFFKDKGASLNKSTVAATSFLSSKSIERRKKVLPQNKLIDETDFPVYQPYVAQLEATGCTVNQLSKWFNAASVWTTKAGLSAIEALDFVKQLDVVQQLAKSKFSEAAQPASLMKHASQAQKTTGNQGLDYGPSLTQLSMIKVPDVQAQGYAGQGVVVAVLDAGFNNLAHEVFSQIKIIAQHDFVNHQTSVADGKGLKGSGTHGTGTLSTIGGYKPGQLIGPAYKASFILAKTENTDSESPVEEDNWIAGMEWADSIGVDVTSTSLGYLTFDDTVASSFNYSWKSMDGRTCRITRGAEMAARKGICVVNSAGNEGYNADHNTLDAPADADSIITAGAVTTTGQLADFSSVGNTIDGRTKPDVVAPGDPVYIAGPGAPDYYYYASGTSFSCPLTAGVVAQLLSAKPSLTPMEIITLIHNYASNAGQPNRLIGWGLVNALNALNNIDTAVEDPVVKKSFELYQNFPNPFNPSTVIRFSLDNDAVVNLSVYSVTGQYIKTLISGSQTAGIHSAVFETDNLSSGVYFYRLNVYGNNGSLIRSESKKMVHLK